MKIQFETYFDLAVKGYCEHLRKQEPPLGEGSIENAKRALEQFREFLCGKPLPKGGHRGVQRVRMF